MKYVLFRHTMELFLLVKLQISSSLTTQLVIDLNGINMTCDCCWRWVKINTLNADTPTLNFDTNPCMSPSHLVGVAWASITEDQLVCEEVTTLETTVMDYATQPDQTTLPDATTIATTLPDATTIATTLPDATTIATTLPDATTIATTLPDATTIATTLPDATTIATTLPDAKTIATTLPDATMAETTLPIATSSHFKDATLIQKSSTIQDAPYLQFTPQSTDLETLTDTQTLEDPPATPIITPKPPPKRPILNDETEAPDIMTHSTSNTTESHLTATTGGSSATIQSKTTEVETVMTPFSFDPQLTMTSVSEYYQVSWNKWLPWTQCTLPCAGGTRFRLKVCATVEDTNCSRQLISTQSGLDIGYAIQIDTCNTHHCPINGAWLPWQSWGACSATCGTGVIQRRRECLPPMYGGDECDDDDHQTEMCAEQECKEKKVVRIEKMVEEETYTEADRRTSAHVIGSSAIMIMAIIVSLVLIFDATSIRRHFGYMKHNLQTRFHPPQQYEAAQPLCK